MSREVVYGRNPVRELIRAGLRPVHEIWALPTLRGEPWLAGLRVQERPRGALGRAAGSSMHQGVVAFTESYPYAEMERIDARPGPLVVADGAQDPRNLGAIARVAEAAGCAGLVIARRGGAGVTPVAARASAGAVEHLPIARVGSVVALLHDLGCAGRTVVGTDPGGTDHRDAGPVEDLVLVLGAEGAGLRPRVRELCDMVLAIPMAGAIESLNVSVAAGILLYALQPRR